MKEEIIQKIAPAAYLVYGLANLAIFVLSGFSVGYIAIIGILCLIAGGGLWLKLSLSLWLALPLGLVLPVIGAVTLNASIGLNGFSPSQQVALMNIALMGYTVASPAILIYLAIKRKISPLKTPEDKEKS